MPLRNWEDGVEIVRSDLNSIPKALQRELYDRLAYELIQRAENAFFQDSFLVSFSSANSVVINAGLGFQSDSSQVSPEPQKRPLYIESDMTELIDTPDSVNNRIDIVCVKASIVDELTASRKFKDATSSVISNQSVVIQKDWSVDIQIVAGTPSLTPAIPATPAGYIKIAELAVTAVTGLAGAGAVTDKRSIIPLGSSTTVNTTGYQRLPAGSAKTLSELFASVDAYLKNGYFNYFDIDEINAPTAEPASPGANKQRLFYRDGVLYIKSSAGIKTPVGSGSGGGGGGANWQPVAGLSPVESYEFDEKVWMFESGAGQALTLWSKVPNGFISGRQPIFKGAFYSPSTANQFKFQIEATLIRKNNDAITSTTNVNIANSGDITNAVANRMRELSIDLASTLGAINGVAISAGDIIKLKLVRIAGTSEDTADVRFIPSSTEVLY